MGAINDLLKITEPCLALTPSSVKMREMDLSDLWDSCRNMAGSVSWIWVKKYNNTKQHLREPTIWCVTGCDAMSNPVNLKFLKNH